MSQKKYIVVRKSGKLLSPQDCIKSNEFSEGFKQFVNREALAGNARGIPDGAKPEYLKFASKMGFNWEPNSGSGFAQYDYKANFIMRMIKEYARQLVQNIGFPIYEVQGSNMFDLQYPVVEAYAKLYGDRLFKVPAGKNQLVMSYDASYPQFNLAQGMAMSHKQLPFGHFSISDCYRNEQSGECMLLYRHRRFFMADIHPYFHDLDEAFAWYPKMEAQILQAAKEVNAEYQVLAEIASDKDWKEHQERIISIAKGKRDILVEIRQDNKPQYWIINVDYKLMDKLDQSREIGCIQVDVGNAPRLGIEYMAKDNKKQNPVIIHSAIPGGIERFAYVLFDDFANRFPLWLHPIQLRLLPIADQHLEYCEQIIKQHPDIRIDIDDRSEPLGKKLKQAKQELIPYSVVIGDKEIQGKGNSQQLVEAIQKIQQSQRDKPQAKMNWPVRLSQRIG